MPRPTVYALARTTVALIWLWHGLVPKLIFLHADELLPLTNAGISPETAKHLVLACGVVEIALGLTLLLRWRSRWPLWVTIIAMPMALVGVAMTAPILLTQAFNPASTNLAMAALAAIALLSPPSSPES